MDTWKEEEGPDGWRECGAATQLQVGPQGGTVELIVKAGDPHSNESLIPAFLQRGVVWSRAALFS